MTDILWHLLCNQFQCVLVSAIIFSRNKMLERHSHKAFASIIERAETAQGNTK